MSRTLTTTNTNTNSDQVIQEVTTSTGFSAGDLVYYNRVTGSYGTPQADPSSTAVFNNSLQNYSYSPGASAGVVQMQLPFYPNGASTSKFNQAILTNGNIVTAYYNPTAAYAYFYISTQAGVQVVAPTILNTGSFQPTNYSNIGYYISVVALVGGGFVVCWNSSGQLTYGVYTNAGAVTTAIQQDTSSNYPSNTTGGMTNIVALPNGGFAVAMANTGDRTVRHRGYTATGTGAYTWVSCGGTNLITVAYFPIGIGARSDNSIVLAYKTDRNNSEQAVAYSVWTSAGAQTLNNYFYPGAPGAVNGTAALYSSVDLCILSDNTAVIGYLSNTFGGSRPYMRRLTSGNSLGVEIALMGAPYDRTYGYTTDVENGDPPLRFYALANGNILVLWADAWYALNYLVVTSTGGLVTGSKGQNQPLVRQEITCYSWYMGICINEITSADTIRLCFINRPAASSANYLYHDQQFMNISSISYQAVPATPIALQPTITVPMTASASYNPGLSTPTKAYWTATDNVVIDTYKRHNGNQATNYGGTYDFVKWPTVIPTGSANSQGTNNTPDYVRSHGDGLNINGLASCTLPNGNMVVAWQSYANQVGGSINQSTVWMAIISPTGSVLQSPIFVGFTFSYASASGAPDNMVKICPTTNNKVVVALETRFTDQTYIWQLIVMSPTSSDPANPGYAQTLAMSPSSAFTGNYSFYTNQSGGTERGCSLTAMGLTSTGNDRIVFGAVSIRASDGYQFGHAIVMDCVTGAILASLPQTNYPSIYGYQCYRVSVAACYQGQGFWMVIYQDIDDGGRRPWFFWCAETAPNTFTYSSYQVINDANVSIANNTQNRFWVTHNNQLVSSYYRLDDNYMYVVAFMHNNLGQPTLIQNFPWAPNSITTGNAVVLGMTSTGYRTAFQPQSNDRYYWITWNNQWGRILPTTDGGDVSWGMIGANSYYIASAGTAQGSYHMSFFGYGTWQITSGPGNTVMVVYRSFETKPMFFITRVVPESPAAIMPNGTSTSAIYTPLNRNNGYVLAGVALQTVAAGGAGQILVNGTATLNSNYPATGSGTFDFSAPNNNIGGAKGSWQGRNIVLQGNTP
jgi:hypothetical protein